MKRGKLLEIISVCLVLALIVLFILNFNSYKIVVDKDHYYCAQVMESNLEININGESPKVSGEPTPVGGPSCYEIDWTLEDVLSESKTLKYMFVYGAPILALILFLISFMVLFTEEGWPKIASKTILIASLLFGLFSYNILRMWTGASSGNFIILSFILAIAFFSMGVLIIKFDRNKIGKYKKIIIIILGVIVYSITVYLIFFMSALPHVAS